MTIKTAIIGLSLAALFFLGIMLYPWSGGNEKIEVPDTPDSRQNAPSSPADTKQAASSEPESVKTEQAAETAASKGSEKKSIARAPEHLEFIGTIMRSNATPCAVIRNTVEDKQDVYCIDDKIDSGRISRIEKNQVVIKKTETQYILTRTGHDASSGDAESPPARDLPPTDFSRPDTEQVKKGWDEVQTLMQQVELNEHKSGDRSDGMVVRAVEAGSVFDKAGLQPGDIIHAINDKKITIPDDAMEIYETFRTESSVHINATRDGEKIDLTLDR